MHRTINEKLLELPEEREADELVARKKKKKKNKQKKTKTIKKKQPNKKKKKQGGSNYPKIKNQTSVNRKGKSKNGKEHGRR